MREIIHEWVLKQIKDNTKVIGGDSGVKPLLAAYLNSPIERVEGITTVVFRTRQLNLSSLYSELDHRVKDKLKSKKKEHSGQQYIDYVEMGESLDKK